MGYNRNKHYACFTKEQQDTYNNLTVNRQRYVDFRGEGYGKGDAYKMAGFGANKASQKAYMLERDYPHIKDLIDTIQGSVQGEKIATDFTKQDSMVNEQINAIAKQEFGEKLQGAIDQRDPEMMKRIQFYRDIMNGKIKTVRKTVRLNALGAVIETKIEETSDIETRIKARKEIDRILGLSTIPDLGSLQVGDITINIVDASKKEELEDSRNNVVLDIDKEEDINGEKVVVVEETVEQEGGQGDGTKRQT